MRADRRKYVKRQSAQRFCFMFRVWHCGCDVVRENRTTAAAVARPGRNQEKIMNRNCCLVMAICLAGSMASADSLQLKNGSLINGTFMGGTESEISFQVGSSVQKYDRADIASLKFESETASGALQTRPASSQLNDSGAAATQAPSFFTIPAGTRISVRTVDRIDSTKSHVGDRFQASLAEPLAIDGNIVVPKDADVYGRLAESKKSGTFTGKI